MARSTGCEKSVNKLGTAYRETTTNKEVLRAGGSAAPTAADKRNPDSTPAGRHGVCAGNNDDDELNVKDVERCKSRRKQRESCFSFCNFSKFKAVSVRCGSSQSARCTELRSVRCSGDIRSPN